MDEYITKESVHTMVRHLTKFAWASPINSERRITVDTDDVHFGVDKIPAADVAPVVHGRWENGNPICPVCGEDKFKDLDADIWVDWQPPFCPNCGAKIDGDFCSYGEQK